LAAGCPFTFIINLDFTVASHYLRPKLYYYTWLVKIALGDSRNLMVYSQRFTQTTACGF